MLFSFWAQTLFNRECCKRFRFFYGMSTLVLVCLYYFHNVVLGSKMTGVVLRGIPALFHS